MRGGDAVTLCDSSEGSGWPSLLGMGMSSLCMEGTGGRVAPSAPLGAGGSALAQGVGSSLS